MAEYLSAMNSPPNFVPKKQIIVFELNDEPFKITIDIDDDNHVIWTRMESLRKNVNFKVKDISVYPEGTFKSR